MVDPDGKFAGQHLKEFDGKQSQSATKEGLEGENERRFVFAGLKRAWDNNMNVPLAFSPNIMKNTLNMAYLGLMLLTFMTVHLFQFRFGDTSQFGGFKARPPPYLINFFWGATPTPGAPDRAGRGPGIGPGFPAWRPPLGALAFLCSVEASFLCSVDDEEDRWKTTLKPLSMFGQSLCPPF